MKLKIFLDSDSYEWLWNHVPLQALSRAALSVRPYCSAIPGLSIVMT